MVRQCNVLHNYVTVATLPNGLQLRRCVRDKVLYKQCLHVPYKSELIITLMSIQTSLNTPNGFWFESQGELTQIRALLYHMAHRYFIFLFFYFNH